jgi:hypothetical protein
MALGSEPVHFFIGPIIPIALSPSRQFEALPAQLTFLNS